MGRFRKEIKKYSLLNINNSNKKSKKDHIFDIGSEEDRFQMSSTEDDTRLPGHKTPDHYVDSLN